MADLGSIAVKITGDTKELDDALDKSKKKVDDFSKDLQKFGTDMSKYVTLPILAIGAAFVKAAADSEKSEAALKAALKATGQEVENTTASMKTFASSLQEITAFEDDAIIASQGLLVSLGNINEQGLKKVTPAMLDFAQAMGVDLQTAASLIGKTIGTGTNALARYGVEIDATLSPTQKLASVTEQLTTKFGGAAEAAGQTFSGRLSQLKNSVGDLAEEFGGIMLPILTDLINAVKPIIEAFTSLDDDTKKLILTFAGIAAAIGPAIVVAGKLDAAFKVLQANPILLGATAIIAGIVALSAAFGVLKDALTLDIEEIREMNAELYKTQAAAKETIGPVNSLTANQKLNQSQVDELIKLYPQLTNVLKANTTSTIAAAEAVRLAAMADNAKAFTAVFNEASKLATEMSKYNGILADTKKAGHDIVIGGTNISEVARTQSTRYNDLTIEMNKYIAAGKDLSITTQKRIDMAEDEALIADLRRKEAQKSIQDYNALGMVAGENARKQIEAEKAKAEAAKLAAEERKQAEQDLLDTEILLNQNAITNQSEYWTNRIQIVRTAMDQQTTIAFDYYKNLDNLALESADDFIALTDSQKTASENMTGAIITGATESARVQTESHNLVFGTYLTNSEMILDESKRMMNEMVAQNRVAANLIDDIFSGLYASLTALVTMFTDSAVSEIERQRDAALEAAGLQEDTKIESLQKQLDKAIQTGDLELQAELKDEIERERINEKFNRRIAKEEYEGAKFLHSLQVLAAIASAAGAVLSAFASVTPTAGPIAGAAAAVAAGIFGGVQIASVVAAAPKPPTFAQGGIVMPQAGGMLANVAEAGQPEVIFPLDKLGSFLSSAGISGGESGSMMQIIVQMDSKPILDKIFPATRNGRVLIDARAVV